MTTITAAVKISSTEKSAQTTISPVEEIFKKYLADQYLPDAKPEVTDATYKLAYEHGHVERYGMLEEYYADFAQLVRLAMSV